MQDNSPEALSENGRPYDESKLSDLELDTLRPVPAATSRSPNRKPRSRTMWKLWQTRQAKKLFLRVYRLTGNTRIACERVDRHRDMIMLWKRNDPAFRAEMEDVKGMWKALHEGSLENLTLKAVSVFEQAMEQTDDGQARIRCGQGHSQRSGVSVRETQSRATQSSYRVQAGYHQGDRDQRAT